MLSSVTVAWLAATLLLPAAEGVTFKIRQQEVKTEKRYTRNIAAELLHTQKKRGHPLTKYMAAAQNNISANPEYAMWDRLYLSPVSIGTPPQTFMMQFDTGSSDFWIFSDLQPKNQLVGHSYFQPKESSSYTPIKDSSWSVGYQDVGSADSGTAKGVVGTDIVSMGGVSAMQGIELAQSASAAFVKDKPTAGIVGLGRSVNNRAKPKQTTFFSNILGSLDSPVMCAEFNYRAPGTWAFGYNDVSSTGLNYYTMDADNEWAVTIAGTRIGPGDMTPTSIRAIVDTGTAGIIMDEGFVTSFWGQVPGASKDKSGLWTFPCANDPQIPELTLQFTTDQGNYYVYIDAQFMNYRTTSSKCYGALVGNGGSGETILGDMFLNYGHTYFDLSSGSPKIGQAPYTNYYREKEPREGA